jgi:hypothetical protein
LLQCPVLGVFGLVRFQAGGRVATSRRLTNKSSVVGNIIVANLKFSTYSLRDDFFNSICWNIGVHPHKDRHCHYSRERASERYMCAGWHMFGLLHTNSPLTVRSLLRELAFNSR